MTIMSSLVSLACVYHVGAGGNKPQSSTSSERPVTAASSASQRLTDDANSKTIAAIQPKVLLSC